MPTSFEASSLCSAWGLDPAPGSVRFRDCEERIPRVSGHLCLHSQDHVHDLRLKLSRPFNQESRRQAAQVPATPETATPTEIIDVFVSHCFGSRCLQTLFTLVTTSESRCLLDLLPNPVTQRAHKAADARLLRKCYFYIYFDSCTSIKLLSFVVSCI